MKVADSKEQQREGSLAARFERLLDLYAPMTDQTDGSVKRDQTHGVISREDFIRLPDEPGRP